MHFFSTGRFDFHIELHALTVPQRKALLKHQVEEHELQCSEEVLSDIASKCEGYDAYDLVMLTFFPQTGGREMLTFINFCLMNFL